MTELPSADKGDHVRRRAGSAVRHRRVALLSAVNIKPPDRLLLLAHGLDRMNQSDMIPPVILEIAVRRPGEKRICQGAMGILPNVEARRLAEEPGIDTRAGIRNRERHFLVVADICCRLVVTIVKLKCELLATRQRAQDGRSPRLQIRSLVVNRRIGIAKPAAAVCLRAAAAEGRRPIGIRDDGAVRRRIGYDELPSSCVVVLSCRKMQSLSRNVAQIEIVAVLDVERPERDDVRRRRRTFAGVQELRRRERRLADAEAVHAALKALVAG